MRETWKKSRLSAAVALIVQCCGFVAAGVGLLFARKKESAAAFSIVGLLSGVVGLYLLLLDRIEAMEFETFKSHLLGDDDDDYAFGDDSSWWDEEDEDEEDEVRRQVEIPLDDSVDEGEFVPEN